MDCLRLKGQQFQDIILNAEGHVISVSRRAVTFSPADPELISLSTGQGRWTSGQSGRRPTYRLGTRHGEVPQARRRVFSLDARNCAGRTRRRSGCAERYGGQSPINSGAQAECRLDRVEDVSGIRGEGMGECTEHYNEIKC
jgi:hypothetical protein